MIRDEHPASDAQSAALSSGKSPGARLRAARERLGLSLQQVADRLRLHPTVIEGIEADNYAGLGAPVYVRGHLRRVAELVGESGAEIEALFRGGASNHGMPDLTRIVTQKYRSSQQTPRLGTWPIVLIGGLILLGGVVWWAMQQAPRAPSGSQVINIPVTAATAVSSAPATTAPGASAPETPEQGAAVGNATTTVAAGAGAVSALPATKPPLSPNAVIPPSLSKQPIPRGVAAAGASATATPGTATPAATNSDRLALHFREDSWVEAYGADGSRLFYDVGSAGTQHDLAGPGPWKLVLGNADGVTLVVNGRTVALGRALRETPNVHLTLDRTGRVSETQ